MRTVGFLIYVAGAIGYLYNRYIIAEVTPSVYEVALFAMIAGVAIYAMEKNNND